MNEQTFERLVFFGIITSAIGVVVFIALDIIYKPKRIEECMADGYKRYECVAILRGCSSTVVPIITRIK